MDQVLEDVDFQDIPDPSTASIRITDSGRLEVVYTPMRHNFIQHPPQESNLGHHTMAATHWVHDFATAVDPAFVNELITEGELTGTQDEPEADMTNPQPPPVVTGTDAPVISARAIIHEASEHVRQIAAHLEKLRMEQKRVPLPLQNDHFKMFDKAHGETKAAIEFAEKRLNQLIDTVILEPSETELALQLADQLALQLKQCTIFIQELYSFQKPNTPPVVGLVIVAQPFPASVKQNKPMDESVTLRLLTGAKVDPLGAAPIKGEVINTGSSNKTKKNQIAVENADRLLQDGIATFTELKFPNGTRKKAVRMKFVAKVIVRDGFGITHTIQLESGPTKPLVVKTNENQWHEAEGTLLQESAFGGQLEITWSRFVNYLIKYYLMATRQSTQAPIRLLTPYDFEYLHQLKFDNSPMVTQKQFDNFWAWLGPMLHKIRYQRHICSLWTRGYICGFLTKNEVEAVLQNEKVGTFLIRFSERAAGAFVVSYQALDDQGKPKVKHYLMQVDDTYAAKKTLPDFLGEFKHLGCLLQLWYDPQTQRRILRRCDKDTVLREYYSKREGTHVLDGYVDVINVI